MEDKSIEELEHEKVILELCLLRLNKEIAERKAKSRRELELKDRSGVRICVGDRVRLLTKSSKSSPFSGIKEAVVLDTAHKGRRVQIGLVNNPSVYTDRVSTSLEVIKDDVKEISSGEETRRFSNQEEVKQAKQKE